MFKVFINYFKIWINKNVFISNPPQSGNRNRNQSTWRNVLTKMKMMLPYVWPKGSISLQIIVGICILFLGAGRAVNVFVPTYSKYIGGFFVGV